MTTLEHLKITNFRGFDSLEIDGLSKVNLFVGKNNSGKTSVLEAIFLLIGMSNPILPSTINLIRGLNTLTANQFKYLFHNLKYENKPLFKGMFSDIYERELVLNIRVQSHDIRVQSQRNDFSPVHTPFSSTLSAPEIVGIDLIFSEKKKHSQKVSTKSSAIYGIDGMIHQTFPPNYKETLSATYITGINDAATLHRYAEIVKRNNNNIILDALQAFDNNIVSVQPLPDGIYFGLKNINELVPCNIMGDGIRRFLNIVTAVTEKQSSSVCIDEIENGLHYSAYKLLWESLLSFSKTYDVQLFITTHNIETLECLKSVLEEEQYGDMREYCKVFNVAKTKNAGFQAYKYSFEGFKDAVDHENEIRN